MEAVGNAAGTLGTPAASVRQKGWDFPVFGSIERSGRPAGAAFGGSSFAGAATAGTKPGGIPSYRAFFNPASRPLLMVRRAFDSPLRAVLINVAVFDRRLKQASFHLAAIEAADGDKSAELKSRRC